MNYAEVPPCAGVADERALPCGLCCVGSAEDARTLCGGLEPTLEAGRELRDPDPAIHRQVGGESVVAATQVLHERVPAHDCSS
jgi:hypothetical protein